MLKFPGFLAILLKEADVITRAVIASLVLAATIGCRSSEQKQAEDAARQIQEGAAAIQRAAEQAGQGSAEQTAQGLQQLAQGLQQMAQGQTKAVDFETLKTLLPTVSGWTQSDAHGDEVTTPIAYSRAEAQYRKGDSTVRLEIMDSAMSQVMLAPLSMFLASGYSERSDNGFKRATKIGEHPAMEEWDNSARGGDVTTVVGNRFIVKASGNQVDDLAVIRQVVEAIDLSKLAALN